MLQLFAHHSWMQVDVGRYYREDSDNKDANNYESRQVMMTVIHGDYDSTPHKADIALLLLDKPVLSKPYVGIAPANLQFADGDPLTVAGWGNTQEKGYDPSPVLRQVVVDYIPLDKCGAYASTPGKLTTGMLCAGYADGGRDACAGDSGGPLMKLASSSNPTLLVGVVSWGTGCARASYPGVYTSIPFFRPWIDKYLNDWAANGTAAALANDAAQSAATGGSPPSTVYKSLPFVEP